MPTREEIEWLESLGFDYYKYENFGNFLIENKEVTQDLADASGENVIYVFVYGLPNILRAGLPGGVDGLRVLVDLADASGENVMYVFVEGLPNILRAGLPGGVDGLRVLVDLVKVSGENVGDVFVYGLPRILKADLPGGVDGLRVLVDLANLSGNYFKIFLDDEVFLLWYFNQVKNGNKLSLKELLIVFNRRKFPGFSDELYEKMDYRISKTKHPEEVGKFLGLAVNGRNAFKTWYRDFNVERLRNLASLGVDLDYWLGKKRFRFKDVVISVKTGEDVDIIDRELPRLRQWFIFLLETVNDPNFVLAQIFSKVQKASDVDGLFVFLMDNHSSIPGFVRDIVFKVVKEKTNLSSIPENDLRKLVNTFYGRAIARGKAREKQELSHELHELQSEFEFVRAMGYEQLVKDLPFLRVGAYVMSRLGEFAKACPKPGMESDFTRAIHELERVAQAIENLLASKSEKYQTHFKGKYDLRFRIRDKFPLEVLTIGDDGHACIQPGGMAESAGFNYFNDSDALLVEILSTRLFKNRSFSLWKRFERVGFVLAFACVDDRNRPVIGLNTVEIAKSWPDDVKAEFFDAVTEWLIQFAKKAGFRAIMIGRGYGSEYFRQKYGSQNVSFRKINPYPTEKYYSNTFEECKPIKTPEGIVLQYQGSGTIIWEE